MSKDIGSIYSLSKESILIDNGNKLSLEDRFLFSLCRESIYSIAVLYENSNKNVLLPAYTCDTVIAPFRQLGWKCHYFSLNKSLRIDKQSFVKEIDNNNPAIVLVHPYYGMDFIDEEIELLRYAKGNDSDIIVDLTQSIYTEQHIDFIDYYVGSYRKWNSIPDGGFLKVNNKRKEVPESNLLVPDDENTVFVSAQSAAMVLRKIYFETDDELIKTISRNLTRAADIYSEEFIKPHRMSELSQILITKEDIENNKKQRLLNFEYLFNNLKENDLISFVIKDLSSIKSAPLYFPIFTSDRRKVQNKLIEKHVYAPVLWPVEDDRVLVDKVIDEIYNTMLVIPIDQRYGIEDMKKIANIINGLL